jgi:CelD/BcsL family acetyltransferase involved in cellulose biosynthesis
VASVLTARHITTIDEFSALREPWDSIARRNRLPPFLTPAWFHVCIQAYSEGKSLAIQAVYDDDRLVGIAPLWSLAGRHRGVPVRMLTFITCPDTPLADLVVDGPDPEPVVALLHEQLFRADLPWDIARFSQWPADSGNYRLFLRVASSRRTRFRQKVSSMTPYVEIRDDWDTFLGSRSAKFRKTHRNIANRIARNGGVTVELFRQDPSSRLLQEIASISSRGWKDAKGFSLSGSPATGRFFAELTRTASKEGWLYVWLLRVRGIPAAMEYDLLADGRAYALRADYDPDYSDLSPGRYLEARILQDLFATNQLEYRTGPGLNTYKLHLAEQVRENQSLTVYRNTARGVFSWNLEARFVPPAKRVRDKLRTVLRRHHNNWKRAEPDTSTE